MRFTNISYLFSISVSQYLVASLSYNRVEILFGSLCPNPKDLDIWTVEEREREIWIFGLCEVGQWNRLMRTA